MMLSEEVFAVEIVVASAPAVAVAGMQMEVGWIAGSSVTPVEAQLEVLGRDVAFPFIFGGEAAAAAVVREGANEGAGAVSLPFGGGFSL
jgi:hypothetical protein